MGLINFWKYLHFPSYVGDIRRRVEVVKGIKTFIVERISLEKDYYERETEKRYWEEIDRYPTTDRKASISNIWYMNEVDLEKEHRKTTIEMIKHTKDCPEGLSLKNNYSRDDFSSEAMFQITKDKHNAKIRYHQDELIKCRLRLKELDRLKLRTRIDFGKST